LSHVGLVDVDGVFHSVSYLLAVVFGAHEMVDPDGEPGDADGTARPVALGTV